MTSCMQKPNRKQLKRKQISCTWRWPYSAKNMAMEVIQLLEMCQKNFTTVKQAFSRFGLLDLEDGNRPFNKLTEKEVFAYLINWILNNMHSSEKTTVSE